MARRSKIEPDSTRLYRARFGRDAEEGFAYLESLMTGRSPSFGYSLLAHILASTRHRVVITTNFDNLVSDALFVYSGATPLVCGHESLVPFARAHVRRPLIVKLHRDLLLGRSRSHRDSGGYTTRGSPCRPRCLRRSPRSSSATEETTGA